MDQGGRSRLIGESAWIALAQGGGMVARLAGVKALTTILSPAAYGEATLLLGVAAFGTNVFCLPFLQAALRFYPEAVAAGRLAAFRRLIGRGLSIALFVLLVLLAVGAVLYDRVGPGGLSAAGAVCVAALLVADTARMFESGLLNAARRQKVYSLWNLLDACARPACAVAAALVLSSGGTSVVLGTFAGCVLAALPFLPSFESGRGATDADADEAWLAGARVSIHRFVRPLVPFAILGWVIGIGDRYVVAGLSGKAEAGVYGAAYGLASQPFLAVSAIGVTLLRPLIFSAAAAGDGERLTRAVRRWVFASIGIAIVGPLVVAAASRPLVGLLTGPQFVGAAPLLVWIAAGYGLQGLQYVFETVLYAQRATGRLMAVQCVGASVAIVLYGTLIPRYGAMGAAWATFGSFAASSLASVALSRGIPLLRGRDARIPTR